MDQQQERRGHRLFAAIYDRMSRPVERGWLGELRSQLVGDLTGDVLDIGAGTGANLPHFRDATKVVAAEPDPAMRQRLHAKLSETRGPVEISSATAEALPFPDDSFDAATFMLVLCSVDDPDRALAEARRVLKPGARLVFIEHVRSTGRMATWQDRLEPLWVRIGAGCHPNRDTQAAIEQAGFTIQQIETITPKPCMPITSPVIQGVAATPVGRVCAQSNQDPQ